MIVGCGRAHFGVDELHNLKQWKHVQSDEKQVERLDTDTRGNAKKKKKESKLGQIPFWSDEWLTV